MTTHQVGLQVDQWHSRQLGLMTHTYLVSLVLFTAKRKSSFQFCCYNVKASHRLFVIRKLSFHSDFIFRKLLSPSSRLLVQLALVKEQRYPVYRSYNYKSSCERLAPEVNEPKGLNQVMDLQQVVGVLKSMAPLSLAGSWDNTGLLIEPSAPHTVSRLMLTNDLTPEVMQEAIKQRVNMIVSYHPPIFAPLKRITQGSWKERLVGQCLESRIALYSPHTSWDALADGLNDWLIRAFDVTDVKPLEQTVQTVGGFNKELVFRTTAELAALITQQLLPNISSAVFFTENVATSSGDGGSEVKVHIQCPDSCLGEILAALNKKISIESVQCFELSKIPLLGYGMGRLGCLSSPISVETAVTAVKSHLCLSHVRLAQAAGTAEIRSVAVCAGSGGSVLKGIKADLFLTGEMSHHEVLDAVCQGTHVILCDHSNTERGFLRVVRDRLASKLEEKVQVFVSEKDQDPLVIV